MPPQTKFADPATSIDLPHPSQFTDDQIRLTRELFSPEVCRDFRRAIHEMRVAAQVSAEINSHSKKESV